MALSYKARKRLAILVLVVAMPAYIVAVVSLLALIGEMPFLVELVVYVGLGVVWVLPLRRLFLGLGQPDPDAPRPQDDA